MKSLIEIKKIICEENLATRFNLLNSSSFFQENDIKVKYLPFTEIEEIPKDNKQYVSFSVMDTFRNICCIATLSKEVK